MNSSKQPTRVVLETRGVYKQFGNVIANNSIDFDLFEGEIHALLGENGAGKTTFVNILYGLYNLDDGEIFIHGSKMTLKNPREAIDNGIGMVHQNFMLIGPFTTAENIFLGAWKKGQMVIDPRKMEKTIEEATRQYGFEYDLTVEAASLPVGIQQRVEIVKALYKGANILILDEPTAVLTPQETKKLFANLRDLKSKGISIIFISHKLDEVLGISDRVTVFRNGEKVSTVITAQTDESELARMMIGHKLEIIEKPSRIKQDLRLKVENLTVIDAKGNEKLKSVSFQVEKGQILGFAGIDGNGQMELANALSGIRAANKGRISFDGNPIEADQLNPRVFHQLGGAYIPQDRLRTGVVPEFKVYENLILKNFRDDRNTRLGLLQFKKIKDSANQLLDKFDIRPADIDLITRKLSGGNIQKVILARELNSKPSIIIASYPTRGLDIGATDFVYRQLLSQRAQGTSILLFSNELQELLDLSDLIAVLHRGQIIAIVEPAQTTPEKIGLLMLGKQEQPDAGF